MITKNQASYLNRLIRDLVDAECTTAFAGSYPPAERLEILEDRDTAKAHLNRYIEKLQRK